MGLYEGLPGAGAIEGQTFSPGVYIERQLMARMQPDASLPTAKAGRRRAALRDVAFRYELVRRLAQTRPGSESRRHLHHASRGHLAIRAAANRHAHRLLFRPMDQNLCCGLVARPKFGRSLPTAATAGPTLAWYRDVLKAEWSNPSDVKAQFGSVGILQDGRVVFNIAGNKYRIVVWINYPYRVVYIRFIGTHKQYDAIDAQTI